MEIGFDPVIFTQRTYLRTSLTIHSIFYHFLILNQPTNSKYTFFLSIFLSLFQLSTHSTLLLLLLLSTRVVWFLVLDYSVHVSKSFQHPTHSKSTFSFLPKHIFDSHSNPTTLQPFHISTIPSIHPSIHLPNQTPQPFLSLFLSATAKSVWIVETWKHRDPRRTRRDRRGGRG